MSGYGPSDWVSMWHKEYEFAKDAVMTGELHEPLIFFWRQTVTQMCQDVTKRCGIEFWKGSFLPAVKKKIRSGVFISFLSPYDVFIEAEVIPWYNSLRTNASYIPDVSVEEYFPGISHCLVFTYFLARALMKNNYLIRMLAEDITKCLQNRKKKGTTQPPCIKRKYKCNDDFRGESCMDLLGDLDEELVLSDSKFVDSEILQLGRSIGCLESGTNLYSPPDDVLQSVFAAGISGHSIKVALMVRIFLGKGFQDIVALSCFVWMVPYRHHTLHEVTAAAYLFGGDTAGKSEVIAHLKNDININTVGELLIRNSKAALLVLPYKVRRHVYEAKLSHVLESRVFDEIREEMFASPEWQQQLGASVRKCVQRYLVRDSGNPN